MKRFLNLLLVLAFLSPASGWSAAPSWPSLADQLRSDAVTPHSALEALIAANQDFSLLRPDELRDKLRIPLWLRVIWRWAHPEMVYSAADPTGEPALLVHAARRFAGASKLRRRRRYMPLRNSQRWPSHSSTS